MDLVFITAVDGRRHRELLERVIGCGKPVFIDKPFATDLDDAEAMLAMAEAQGVPLMSSSALRYAEPFTSALADSSLGPVLGVDVYGPMALDEALPGLFWYGCHGIEMIVAAMGSGCEELKATATADTDLHVMRWADGRLASYRGNRSGRSGFGVTIHRAEGVQRIDPKNSDEPFYAGLLKAIMRSLPGGRSDVPAEQMLEVARLMAAGNNARESGDAVMVERAVRQA